MDFARLSPAARDVMSRAARTSQDLSHHYIGVEHLFLALGEDDDSSLNRALLARQLDRQRLRERVVAALEPVENPPWGDEMLFTPRCREVLHLAGRIASDRNSPQIGDVHILEAILREGRSVPVRLLQGLDVGVADLYEAVRPQRTAPADRRTPLLNQYGRDLTAQAHAGSLMPVIGRGAELELVAQVLLRKNKNNPVLVGEAGVGKTAVAEGLAQLLVSEGCPAPLKGCRVVELSIASLVAGTKFRGEFEERLLTVVKEAAGDPGLILFIDELHTLVGAGSAAGESLDASNIFKPALARGELRCIGSTTVEEYRRYIEKDSALERRFEKVMIEEPTVEDARAILEGLRASLESHHEVSIGPGALEAAVNLTVRYLPHRRLPDKAIDAVDQSCARERLKTSVGGAESTARIDAESIACTVSQWTGIPLERISGEEARHLLELEAELRKRVLGQDHAVKAVARSILTAKAGLADPRRPTGVFLFLGPTGVGKTELAKNLASLLFGEDRRLFRFDMSEYSEPHSVAKLIGAPPGYVGHEQEGLLISAVRTHPHCVVLFDELEKAHPKVFDLFLQIFDDGRLSGAHGKTADFRHAVVILTSNLDPQPPERAASVGFLEHGSDHGPIRIDPRVLLTRYLRPELVNRIDEIVVFNRLGQNELRAIIDRYVGEIERLAAERRLELQLDDEVYDHLIEAGFSDRFGARELRRVVDRQLRQPLAEELLRRGDPAGTVRISVEDGAIRFG